MLIGNYSVFLKSPGRWLAGNSTAAQAHAKARSNFGRLGEFRSGNVRDASGDSPALDYLSQVSVPTGYGPSGWYMAAVAGAMNADASGSITLDAQGVVQPAWPTSGQASIALDAVGSVSAVVPVSGFAPILLDAMGNVFAVASVIGAAPIALNAVGNLFATAKAEGQAAISLSAQGVLFATANTSGIAYFSAASEGQTLTAQQIWEYANRTLTSGSAGGMTPQQEAMLRELFEIHGLDPAKPLQVTDTSRTAGAISQSVASSAPPSGVTVAVTRLP